MSWGTSVLSTFQSSATLIKYRFRYRLNFPSLEEAYEFEGINYLSLFISAIVGAYKEIEFVLTDGDYDTKVFGVLLFL